MKKFQAIPTRLRHYIPILSLLILGAGLISACASGLTSRDSAETADGSQTRAPAAQENAASNFEISLYQDSDEVGAETVELFDLLNKEKPIVLNFWAGLCPPCRLEMPDLDRVYQNHKDELILIGVDIGPFTNLGSREDGRELLRELDVRYPSGTTFNESVLQEYEVLGMPSTYFIKPDGTIHETWSGLLTEDKMEELVSELLAASEGS
ncbi:MAG: TlpA family protein disulfide reductase [Anaerolineales bacterium]